MIEIVCPSCQARYRLPEGAIGENGRRVSCSACGHSWHAHPEPEEETLTLGPEAIAEPPPGQGLPQAPGPAGAAGSDDKYAAYDADDRASGTSPYSDEEDRGMAAYEAFARSQEDDEEDGDAPSRHAAREEELAGDRAQQMAQIRSMLDDIKQSPQATPAAAPEPEEAEEEYEEPTPERPSAVESSMREVEEEEERDPLRAKLDQYAKPRKVGDAKVTRTRMLKKHAKKVRRRKMEEKRGSGTFMTGFLLVVLVVSVMAAVYLLAPLIIERFPETEPAVRDYVATMDQFRLWLGEQVAVAQEQIQELIADEQ